MPQSVAIDWDDFRESDNRLDLLFRMRARWPGFKASLYTIPGQCSYAFLDEVSRLDWIELHMHGFMHPRNECKEWDKELADRLFTTVFDMKNRDGKPIFYKGFKAPSWGYNQATVDAARDHGLILGVNTDTSNSPGVVFHEDMKQYRPNGDFVTAKHRAGSLDRFHGHLEVPDCENDLRYYWHYLENRISVDAQFFFISEVVEGLYTKSS